MASLELNKLIKRYVFEVIKCEIKRKLILLLSSCPKRSVLDLQDVFRRFSFDMICRFSFGVDPSCLELSLPMSEFANAFDLASRLSAERAMNVSPRRMRLCPPIQFDSKFCQYDDVLPNGSLLKRGTSVTYHLYAMEMIEEIWSEDCLEFKSGRWLKNGGVFAPENTFKYLVFQAGFRVCLGKEMALVELKTVALSLVRRFHIELEVRQEHHRTPRFSPGLTATFSDGLPVMVREREHGS